MPRQKAQTQGERREANQPNLSCGLCEIALAVPLGSNCEEFIKGGSGGAWSVQSVGFLALDFSSGSDYRVMGLNPASSSVLSMESPCPSPSVPPSVLFLSQIYKSFF